MPTKKPTAAKPKGLPKLIVGADHTGVAAKAALIAHLTARGYGTTDVGSHDENAPDDYPDFAKVVAEMVATGKNAVGILICGTGVGVCIAANKVKGVRAALVYDHGIADLAVRHDDANVLCLGARVTPDAEMALIADAFLGAKFEGGRHSRRVNKVKRLDAGRK